MGRSLIILCLIMLPLISADHDEFDYYDVNEVHDEFLVHCGTAAEPYMRITYGGDAHSVYAAADPENCKATEMGPAVWVIDIEDFDDTLCPVLNSSTGGAPLRMLDVVVQMGSVRQWSDSYKQIICNYGLGGQQVSADTEAIQGVVEKQPVWENAQNATSDDEVKLCVFNTADEKVETVYLGHYIQLRAGLAPANPGTADELSIKVFNCRAFSGSMSYYILVGGCGEGDVIDIDRGFRTRNETCDEWPDMRRVARSSYFKSFLLPGHDEITFECDYILCDPADCDGYSCVDSVMLHDDDRKRRAIESYQSDAALAVPATNSMPKVRTTVKVLPQQDHEQFVISSSDLIRAETPVTRASAGPIPPVTYIQRSSPEFMETIETNSQSTEMDLTTVGLIAGLCTLVVLLVVSLCGWLAVYRRVQQPFNPNTSTAPFLASRKHVLS